MPGGATAGGNILVGSKNFPEESDIFMRIQVSASIAILLSVSVSQTAAGTVSAAPAGRKVATVEPARGPLRVHPANPRYFTDGVKLADGSLKAVYLTGSHTWNNFVDMEPEGSPDRFDFKAYLDFLERHNHNFIRLWAWDLTTFDRMSSQQYTDQKSELKASPQPWLRTGPGRALDGQLKFDLTLPNPAFFQRMRECVSAAGRRGIYVSVMLFEGWGLNQANRRTPIPGWAWRSHPFHSGNNVNGIDADRDDVDSTGEVHRLHDDAVNAVQADYVRKVVDAVNDLDNVLFEVINEGGQKEWDWWVVKMLHDYEGTKPKQHPVGLTGHGAEKCDSLLASPADWISPGRNDGYGGEPPAWNEGKVSLLDTDHIWGIGGNPAWVWKSFLRGHNPIFMDPYDHRVLGKGPTNRWDDVRQAMGQSRRLAAGVNLAAMTPHDELVSTKYCLANPGVDYIVFVPKGGVVTVDLTAASGTLTAEWVNPIAGVATPGGKVAGGGKRELRAPTPTNDDAVLRLWRE